MPFGGFSDTGRLETGTFQKDVGGFVRDAGMFAAHHACQTHGRVCVADDQILRIQFPFDSVQCHERFVFYSPADNHLLSAYFCCVEGVHRLSALQHHKLCDVHNVVYGSDAYCAQQSLHPFRRFRNPDSAYVESGVTRAAFRVLDFDGDGVCRSCFRETADVRILQRYFLAKMSVDGGRKVSGYSYMADGVAAVWGQTYSENSVALHLEIILGRSAGNGRFWQHHDAGMVFTDTKIVLRADHPFGDFAADFRFLNSNTASVGRVEGGADAGDNHILSGLYVRCSAHNMQGLFLTRIHGCDVQMVRIGMGLAGQYLADNDIFQSPFDAFVFFHGFNFQSAIGQQGRNFGCGKVNRQIAFEPLVGYFHRVIFLISNVWCNIPIEMWQTANIQKIGIRMLFMGQKIWDVETVVSCRENR